MTRSTHDVAIIGAGPYGLAAAAHLRSAGLGVRVFGEPMEFWRSQMPGGMLLRSSWDASHISDPEHALTLDKYQEVMGITLPRPVPLENFVEYGQWFQRQVVPDLDQRKVARVESAPSGGFQLTLEDGEWFQAKRVLVATGLASFTNRPAQFDGLPHSLASHSSDLSDL